MRRFNEYIKHPSTPFPLQSSILQPTGSRFDYQNIQAPDNLKKLAFTTDYIKGEKAYWESGMRTQFITDGNKGFFVATNGDHVCT